MAISENKATPSDNESYFGIEELFFSRTDKRGVILEGNDVFVRVSKHPREKLIGSPHNIIRHKDMPKTVFSVLWDTIQAGKSISAYVKNRAADGSYYWVIANVFPSSEGYLSVRFKPSAGLQDTVASVYQGMLAEEKKGGIPAGLAFLVKSLQGIGFSDYGHFMRTFLVAEIDSRAKKIEVQGLQKFEKIHSDDPAIEILGHLVDECEESKTLFTSLFKRIAEFSESTKVLNQGVIAVVRQSRDLRLLSLNMVTISERLGEKGRTVSAIAQQFQKMADEIQDKVSEFDKKVVLAIQIIQESEILLAWTQIQIEMLNFFVRALYINHSQQKIDNFGINSTVLDEVVFDFYKQVETKFREMPGILGALMSIVQELKASVVAIEIVKQSGRVEATQLSTAEQIGTLIDNMETFITQIRTNIENIDTAVKKPLDSLRTVVLDLRSSKEHFLKMSELGNEFLKLKNWSKPATKANRDLTI